MAKHGSKNKYIAALLESAPISKSSAGTSGPEVPWWFDFVKLIGVSGKKTKETDSSGAFGQVLRPTKNKESSIKDKFIHCSFRESDSRPSAATGAKYQVVLIEEGMGNLKDCFYYTRECLEGAASMFEGKKCYVDHPSTIDEQTRPERSVKDIAGNFEGVHVEESEDGAARLVGVLNVLPGNSYEATRTLLSHAVDYSEKYPDKDFIGLSINASGDAEPQSLQEFLKESVIPESAMPKLKQALAEGIDQVRVVKAIRDAVSCDLVTEAGAKGKVLKLL